MQISKAFAAAFLIFSLFSAAPSFAADYKVDPTHSNVGFTVSHMVSKVKGEFKEFDGAFSFDPTKAQADTGKFTVKIASISTNNEKRDEHLKSPDFFDAAKYPEMTLDKVRVVPGKGKGKYKLNGDLTLHGVTKPVSFDLEYGGSAQDPWGNTRAGFTATTKIDRKDFGLNWNKSLDKGGLLVGNDVAIELQVEAIENKPAAAAKKE